MGMTTMTRMRRMNKMIKMARIPRMTPDSQPLTLALAIAVMMLVTLPVTAGQDEQPTSRPTRPTDPTDPPPSLDELLGLEEQRSADETARAESDAELERQLIGDDAGEALAEIIAKMRLAAVRLDEELDTGLGTQRVQEDIMKQLEYLLDLARQQDSPSSSSSSQSSPSPTPSQTPPPSSQAPDQQQQDGQSGSTSDSQGGQPPPMQQGDINTILDEDRQEWGTLPQRVRQMLLQGRQEKFSSLYEQMTREYYRRLAEEGS